jgi:hypothetical protein
VIATRTAVGLVARREIVERVRERSLWISTSVTIVVLAGILVLPNALGFGGPTKGTVAAVGPQAQRVAALAHAQEKAFDVAITARPAADDATAEQMVRDGDADVAVLSGGRRLAAAQGADDSVIGAVQAGSQAARGGSLPPPLPVARAGGDDSDRRGIAFVAVVILYGQLLGYGFWVASGVVEEKATRVVELLLAAIRPRQLLAGKVIGIGVLGLGQLLLIGLFGAVIGAATGQLDVTGDVVSAVGVVLAWFVLVRVRRRRRARAAPGGDPVRHRAADDPDRRVVLPELRGARRPRLAPRPCAVVHPPVGADGDAGADDRRQRGGVGGPRRDRGDARGGRRADRDRRAHLRRSSAAHRLAGVAADGVARVA